MLTNQQFVYQPCRVLTSVAPTGCAAAHASVVCERRSNIHCCYPLRFQRKASAKRQALATLRCGAAAVTAGDLSLGIDCGTSGARSIVIDGKLSLRLRTRVPGGKHADSCMPGCTTVSTFSNALLVTPLALTTHVFA